MIAITRDVSPSVAQCELTHLARTPINYERAVEQHTQYRTLLASLGCKVIDIAADSVYPDCVFIEDTAIVFDELAVITRPGAESRRGEVNAVAAELAQYRKTVRIEYPGTIDGGDVLVLDDRVFVGRSSRTNGEGIAQLRKLSGREVIPIELHGALHLKTAITRVSRDTLIVNREWLDLTAFRGWKFIDVDPSEPFAANALLVGDVVIFPNAFPKTRAKLAHLDVHPVDADELAKAEGGVTCCSLLLR
jgi:dimethylargininase